MTSGVRVSETRVATRSPTARPSGDAGPTSSTVPTSMPPEPVSGFCILPRVATMLEHLGADAAVDRPSRRVLALELAERRGVEVEPLDADPDLVGPQLAAGVEPLGRLGSTTRVVEHPVQSGRIARSRAATARQLSSVDSAS